MMSLAPPVHPLQCAHEDCTLPDGGTCALAAEIDDPERECPHLVRQGAENAQPAPEPAPPTSEEPAGEDREQPRRTAQDAAPWSGRHLDRDTADRLLWRSPARFIAVVGPYDAGKTCLLASFFLQLANGQCQDLPYRFASSRTLHGLHGLLDQIRAWDQASSRVNSGAAGNAEAGEQTRRDVPEIVGRTPKEEGAARFLHLGLCPRDERDRRHVDVLLSDVAGEWFSEYARLADATMKERMAFVGRCDGFVVVADAAALRGSGGRKLDADISRMIRRIVDSMKDAPARPRALALVLSKYDRVVKRQLPPEADRRRDRAAWGEIGKRCTKIWRALEHAERQGLPYEVFPVSAFPGPLSQGQPVGVHAPFAFLLEGVDRRAPWPRRVLPVPPGASSFAAMRRWPGPGHEAHGGTNS